MKTKILPVSGAEDEEALSYAAQVLLRGGLVAFPTETVYGLGGNALDAQAAKKIYAAKGRPSDNPLIIHLSDAGDAGKYCEVTPLFERLTDVFSPGPLTLILKKKACIPDEVTGGGDTVAVRIPADPIARRLIALAGVPIAAPSANLSGHPSPTQARHVIKDLDGRIDVILDGPDAQIGLESTVVKLDGEDVCVLRPGGVTYEQLCACVGKEHVRIDRIVTEPVTADFQPLSPGMKYKHYAPKAQVILLAGEHGAVCAAMAERKEQHGVGILCYTEDLPLLAGENTLCLGSMAQKGDQAHALFAALRTFDETDVDVIYAPVPTTEGIGLAVYNRLMKAAGFCVEQISEISMTKEI